MPRGSAGVIAGARDASSLACASHEQGPEGFKPTTVFKRLCGQLFAKQGPRGKDKMDVAPGQFGALRLLDHPIRGVTELGPFSKAVQPVVANGPGLSGFSLGNGLCEANISTLRLFPLFQLLLLAL